MLTLYHGVVSFIAKKESTALNTKYWTWHKVKQQTMLRLAQQRIHQSLDNRLSYSCWFISCGLINGFSSYLSEVISAFFFTWDKNHVFKCLYKCIINIDRLRFFWAFLCPQPRWLLCMKWVLCWMWNFVLIISVVYQSTSSFVKVWSLAVFFGFGKTQKCVPGKVILPGAVSYRLCSQNLLHW